MEFMNKFKVEIEHMFEITDLSEMSYILGIEVHHKKNKIFIYYKKL